MRADMAIDSKPNPYVLGFSIGVGLALAILVSVLWIPWVWDAKYKQLRDFLFFSVGFFIILIRRYGRGCWVPRFWLALAILALAHSVGCWLLGFVLPPEGLVAESDVAPNCTQTVSLSTVS
jgi:hypothetical protein